MRPLRGALSGVKGVRPAVLFSLMTFDWEIAVANDSAAGVRLAALGLP